MANDVKVTISTNASVVMDDIKALQDRINALEKTVNVSINVPSITKATADNYTRLAEGLKQLQGVKLNNASLAAVTNLAQVQQSMSKMDQYAKKLSASMDKLSKAYSDLGSAGKKTAKDPMAATEKEMDSIMKKAESLNSAITKATTSGMNTSNIKEQYSELEKYISLYKEAKNSGDLSGQTDAFKNAKAALDTLNKSMDDFKNNKSSFETVSKAINALEKDITKLEKEGKDVTSLRGRLEELKQVRDDLLSRTGAGGSESIIDPNASTQVEQLAQGVGELKVATEQAKNAGQGAMQPLQQEVEETKASVTDLGTALKNALGGTVLGGLAKAGIGLMARELRQAAREMVESAVEIESALAQLQVVTGASGSQLDTFFEAAASSAKNFGVEVKDMLGSIETFSRLGLNLNDSLKLSETATTLSNIAAMSVDDATQGLTSVIFGYGKDASEAEHIADVVTKIGQSFAISGSEIMDSMTRVSAAASASNTSFEKTVALLAGGNAAMQDSAKTSTAIRTIMARVRGSKTELEELGRILCSVA